MSSNYENLIGSWVSSLPHDSDDYLAKYTIGGNSAFPVVTAVDIQDGEEFQISNIAWNGQQLSFESLMPSTGRKGINRFRLSSNGNVISEFTFTVVEELKQHAV